mmetsp:Transcript_36840/g.82527  ORF Transcript_36840/g.82527 Transcript_36840/m.82527 type:complete len:222 (-) Transcript_36840:2669-3334(-)
MAAAAADEEEGEEGQFDAGSVGAPPPTFPPPGLKLGARLSPPGELIPGSRNEAAAWDVDMRRTARAAFSRARSSGSGALLTRLPTTRKLLHRFLSPPPAPWALFWALASLWAFRSSRECRAMSRTSSSLATGSPELKPLDRSSPSFSHFSRARRRASQRLDSLSHHLRWEKPQRRRWASTAESNCLMPISRAILLGMESPSTTARMRLMRMKEPMTMSATK